MYFIYPASVSENCDPRIVPAVAKCIERFFLVELQDAMASGVLPLSRKWSGNNYSGLLMECVQNFNKKQSLCESKILLEDSRDEIDNRIDTVYNNCYRETDPVRLADLINDLMDIEQTIDNSGPNGSDEIDVDDMRYLNNRLRNYVRRAQDRLREIRNNQARADREQQRIDDKKEREEKEKQRRLERDQDRQDREDQRDQDRRDRRDQRDQDRQDRLDREDQRQRERAEDRQERADRDRWTRERQLALDDENARRQARMDAERAEDRAREAQEREDEKNKARYRIGNYSPLKTGVDISPTSGTVNVNVLYKGGKLDGKMQEDVDVTINVKVIPTIIKNFRCLENDLLNDYFSRKSEATFKSVGRNIARTMYNKFKKMPFGIGDAIWKAGMTIAGEDVDSESRKDIIYNTQGFVNASAFHKIGASPNNYNYTSNIVIFNKDDLTDPDDQNIFQNRSAMIRLFKMGWSTFCMLDPVEEMMYFISSLDGGYMHPIPYRYIMESMGTRSYYGDNDRKLKDSAKPFFIKRGNFNDFAKQFKKRSKK